MPLYLEKNIPDAIKISICLSGEQIDMVWGNKLEKPNFLLENPAIVLYFSPSFPTWGLTTIQIFAFLVQITEFKKLLMAIQLILLESTEENLIINGPYPQIAFCS